MNEIEQSVADYLKSIGVEYSAGHIGTPRTPMGGKNPMDAWVITLQRGTSTYEEFSYFTGLGHRKVPKSLKAPYWMKGRELSKWNEQNAKPVKPNAAGPLYSFVMDASACEMSFGQWCDEYGYNTDSRKAESTYQSCQEQTDKMRRILSRAEIDHIQFLLQDY